MSHLTNDRWIDRVRPRLEVLEDRTVPTAGYMLLDPDPASVGDGYGISVAASEEYVLVGKQGLGAVLFTETEPGAAHLYDAATGALLHSFSDPVNGPRYGFGNKVAVSDQCAVVAASGISSGGGATYVFDVSSGNLLHTLTDTGLPWAVAVSEKYVAVSSINPSEAFLYDAATGALLHTWSNTGADGFGYSIALFGDRVFVGATRGGVLEFDAVSGSQLHTFAAPGYALAVSDDILLVGSYQTARQFDVDNGNLVRGFVSPTPNAFSSFGNSVAIAGDDLLVADVSLDVVYRFSGVDGTLLQTFEDPTPNGRFGTAIAVTGTTVVVSDPFGYEFTGVHLLRQDPGLALDVRPNSERNFVNLQSNGSMPMALLTSADFNALTVDVSTLRLNWSTITPPTRVEVKDVDHDGDLDLLLYFDIADLLASGVVNDQTTDLVLSGATLDGLGFYVSDTLFVMH